MDAVTFEAALQQQAADILSKCVACGACAEVCPMPVPAGIDAADPRALTAGVLGLLRGGLPTIWQGLSQTVAVAFVGSKAVPSRSMAQATLSRRSATERSALPWL